jgi:hypothetical protein
MVVGGAAESTVATGWVKAGGLRTGGQLASVVRWIWCVGNLECNSAVI